MRADAEALPFRTKSADCLDEHPLPVSRRQRDAPPHAARVRPRLARAGSSPTIATSIRFATACGRLSSTLGLTKRPFERVSVKSMKAEFEDAGLRVRKIIAVRRWLSDKWVVLAEAGHVDPASLAMKLKGTEYADLRGHRETGRGQTVGGLSRALAGPRDRPQGLQTRGDRQPRAASTNCRWRSSSIAATARSSRRAAWRSTWPNRSGSWSSPVSRCHCRNASDGEVYYFAQRDHADFISPRFMEDLAELVTLSHEAKLYDIDLHAMNVMVDRKAGGAQAVRLQPDPVHRAAAESVHRARAQARLVRARIPRSAQARALQQFRSRGTQAAQVLQGRRAEHPRPERGLSQLA